MADTRGKKFEDLVAYLLESIGCIVRRNLVTPLGSQQIDLAVAHVGVLGPIPTFFLVECKFWEKPADSAAVGYFLKTCEDRRAGLGVVFSRNGITGDPDECTRAYSLAFASHCRGTNLLVIDEKDLQSVEREDDLVRMLLHAWMQAAATGSVGRPLPSEN
ncbi:restriction endonuclease [Rhodococcus pyridinivorans]|uniref:restriction endonuclease n=1 Tax=Rhodococcus pyridinivorans TaxID=103816 RepID=UPI0021645E3F|nr:restriction endonuclease [Rhodococcus pyridinivorans]UVT25006.1 restriction endonuclease [Rhodococcus pyridinivorans]